MTVRNVFARRWAWSNCCRAGGRDIAVAKRSKPVANDDDSKAVRKRADLEAPDDLARTNSLMARFCA